jgi:hypothetical protein
MNRILVEFNNAKLLLPENAGGEVLAALLGAIEVTSHGYGSDARYTESETSSLSVTKIPARLFVSDTVDALRLELEEAKKSAAEANSERWKCYTRASEAEKQLKALKEQPAAPAATL